MRRTASRFGRAVTTARCATSSRFRKIWLRASPALSKTRWFFANQIHPDESKYGYIDESGKFVVNPQFDYALDFSGGLAPVCMGDCGYRPVAPRKWGYID